jgi:hypothetical protein
MFDWVKCTFRNFLWEWRNALRYHRMIYTSTGSFWQSLGWAFVAALLLQAGYFIGCCS